MHLDDGIEIHIEPKRAGLSPEKVRALFREILNLYQKIKEEEPWNEQSNDCTGFGVCLERQSFASAG